MTDIERLEDIKNALEKQCMLAVQSTSVIEDKLDIEKVYRSQIQTFENAISALKKQIPKKPIDAGWKHGCPNCGCAVGVNKHLGFAYSEYLEPNESYCCSCGQALDWSDTE